jgi:hypothetical protein
MKYFLVTVGKIKEPFIAAGMRLYQERIARYADFQVLPVKEEKLTKGSSPPVIMEREAHPGESPPERGLAGPGSAGPAGGFPKILFPADPLCRSGAGAGLFYRGGTLGPFPGPAAERRPSPLPVTAHFYP